MGGARVMTRHTIGSRHAPEASREPDWRTRGACRAYNDPEAWFPVGNTGTALLEIEEAKRVCRTCPVMEQCGDYALDQRIADGVWGGMSEAERRSILRRRSRKARAAA